LQQIQRGQAEALEAVNGGIEVDPMAALDRATSGGTAVRGFVAASNGQKVGGNGTEGGENQEEGKGNADEIAIDDDDDEDEDDE
jgi:pre-mRNA-splicing factor SYF1